MKHSPAALMQKITAQNFFSRTNNLFVIGTIVFSCITFIQASNGWSADSNDSDEQLLRQYVQSKGEGVITFDSSNIKQFWIDNSVASKNGIISIILQDQKSVPLKIQLSNVTETMDCKVDVITNNPDLSFMVSNHNSISISSSFAGEDFIQYHNVSALVHLEDTLDFSFNLVFSAKTTDLLSIKKIILSFSENKQSHFNDSPGYKLLKKQIEEEGTAVPNDEKVKYLISHKNHKIFVMFPSQYLDNSHSFSCHVIPADKSSLPPDKQHLEFINMDFTIMAAAHNSNVVPKPYLSKDDFTIIQKKLPAYKCNYISFRQIEPNPPYKELWGFVLKNWGETDKE